MPTITIYLTKDQYDKVCDAPSKMVQAALEYYFKNADDPGQGPAQPQQPTPAPCENESTDENK